jgi:hypothetical protein
MHTIVSLVAAAVSLTALVFATHVTPVQAMITAPGVSRAPCPPGSSRCADTYFVAHYDDDLYFMNPDIETSLGNGNDVVVVYVCGAGNASELYWTNRERGILAAYAQMTDPSQTWTSGIVGIPTADPNVTKDAAVFTHPLSPAYPGRSVTLIFLRLADTQLETLWSSTTDYNAPAPGYRAERLSCGLDNCPLATAMHPDSYSRSELIAVLVEIMRRYGAMSVSTLDLTGLNYAAFTDPHRAPFTDNGSHVAVAMFALAAAQQYQSSS